MCWRRAASTGSRQHREPEAYFVMSGSGRLRMGDEDVAVGPGTTAFVRGKASNTASMTSPSAS